jgi:23S rRNA pseudouridine1911/1915/1917 synthase
MTEPDAIHTDDSTELFEHFRFVVDKKQAPERIDKFLFSKMADISRTRLQQAAKAGNILVNGKTVKSNYKVRPEDLITIVLAFPPRDTEIYPEEIPINIVYEDDDLLVVNKEAGMVVHPGHGNFTGTLLHALLWHFQQEGGKGSQEVRKSGSQGVRESGSQEVMPYLAHRIDKDTTGLLLVAKNEWTQSKLAKQFFDHSVDRSYVALVWGDLPDDSGTITANIIRNPKERTKMAITNEEGEGRHAVTHYKVLERFGYVTLVECRLETGRTHQIRIHFAHMGHPLFNDATYGGDRILKGTTFTKYKQFIENCFSLMPRQALHAKSLGFIHPATGEAIGFDSELPEDFQMVLEKWRRYISNPKHDHD